MPSLQHCFEEARQYHQQTTGFFSILTDSRSGKVQKSYPLTKMAVVLPELDPTVDTWLSQAEFFKPNRRVVNLYRLGLLFADLDYYRLPSLIDRDPESVVWLLTEFCALEGLPVPSLVIFSGRGLQVKWLLEGTIPRQALPRWNACQRVLVNALGSFGADPLAKDASRVLRLVNTVNTKSGEVCRVVHMATGSDGQPLRYNFETLCENLLPVARWDIENERQEREARRQHRFKAVQGSRKGLLKGFSGSRLAWDRLNDLRTLAEMRGGVKEGERMLHLFWQLNFLLLSGATHSTQMQYEARELARQIDPAWQCHHAELSTLYHKAKAYNAGEKVEFNGKKYPPLYTPWTSTLIDLFHIEEREQPHLKTLIGKDEKRARKSRRNAAYYADNRGDRQTRDEYEGEAQARMKEVLKMKSQGFKQKYIAEKLGLTTARISQIVKAAKASDTKGCSGV